MPDRAFVDTNILVYLYSADEAYKRTITTHVFRSYSEPVVSIPILNELCNVMLKKLGVSKAGLRDVVQEISKATLIAKISANTIRKSIDMNENYQSFSRLNFLPLFITNKITLRNATRFIGDNGLDH